ncbi:hypothetical protein GCM10009727_47640 [Actinomadura napierensis]|uniref:Uncharacterized protein n=2 Tax=Actinomadura napierensis TaxID=267854 RepID=A0ABP5LFN5_9ACTN
MFMMSGGSLVPLLALALLVGNQWVIDAINKSGFKFDEGLGPLVSHLFFVAWRFTPPRGLDWRFVVSDDFTTLLMFAVVALLVLAGARTVDPERGVLGALITGWWAVVVACGIAGGVSGLLLKWSIKYEDGSVSRNFFESVQSGAASGLLYGWLAGIGALVGFLLSRPRGQAAPQFGQYAQQQPYNPQQPYAPQQAAPMQQPYAQQPYAQQPYGGPQQGMPQAVQQPMQQPMAQPMQQGMPTGNDQPGLPPQHPAAVPYVPPARPSQSPAWGGVPVPPQQQGAPAPEQEAPAPEAAPQASETTVEPASGQDAPEPEQGAEPAQHEPQDAVPDDAPSHEASPKATEGEDAQDDEDEDDLRLADRTRVDRRPDVPRDPDPMPPPM